MTIKKSYDAVIIGGGHMGLRPGAHLHRAGMETAIFERRHEDGGPWGTSEPRAARLHEERLTSQHEEELTAAAMIVRHDLESSHITGSFQHTHGRKQSVAQRFHT